MLLSWLFVILLTLFIVFIATRNTRDPFKKEYASARPRIVFTLTTLPSRIDLIDGVLKDISKSSVRPDAVYLNIPYRSVREDVEYEIPEHIKETCSLLGITILRCDDFGPATKFYPVLEKESPDTIMLLVDDDQRYYPNSHDEIVEYALNNPNESVGYRGVNINSGKLKYIESGPGSVDVIETYAGVAIRVRHLNGFKPYERNHACFTCDDIAIHACLKKNGISRTLLAGSSYGQGGSVEHPIHHNNSVGGINPLSDENLNGRNEACALEIFN